MIEDRERLERTFELFEMPEPALERLARRRDRRRRRERIAAGLVALALVAVFGAVFGTIAVRQSVPSAEPGYRSAHAGFLPSLAYTVPRGDAWDYQQTFWLSRDLHIGGSSRDPRIWLARDPELASSGCDRLGESIASAEELIERIGEHPALAIEERVATSIGGLTGWRLDVTVRAGAPERCADGVPLLAVPTWRYPSHGLTLEPDVHARVYALDLPSSEGSGVVTVTLTHRTSEPNGRFAEAVQVIETFEFLIDG